MNKVTFAIKIDKGILNHLKRFCMAHGTKYSFFVTKAIEEKLAVEESKDDLLDFEKLRKEKAQAVPLEEYLRQRGA